LPFASETQELALHYQLVFGLKSPRGTVGA
jgi:hypothetical protein